MLIISHTCNDYIVITIYKCGTIKLSDLATLDPLITMEMTDKDVATDIKPWNYYKRPVVVLQCDSESPPKMNI